MTKKPTPEASSVPAQAPTTPQKKGTRKQAASAKKPARGKSAPAKSPKVPAARSAGKRAAESVAAPKPPASGNGYHPDPQMQEARKAITGRPTDYKPEYARQAQLLCEMGATDAELANFFDVAVSTVYLWSVQHPAFSEAKKLGKEKADDRVEQSLYKRAMGYEHDEIDIRTVSVGAGFSEIVKTPIRKHYPPDVTAAIFWLKNRRRDQWRDKIDLDANVNLSFEDKLKELSSQPAPAHAELPRG